MVSGARRQINLVKTMADKGPVWDSVVKKYGLRPIAYQDIVRWPYGDFVFTPGYDVISNVSKLRQFGFHESVDTEEMFYRLWNDMRAEKVLPPVD